MLALSAGLADYPLDREFQLRSEARSRTCGSTIELGIDLASDGRIARIGMQVAACAVGQSSAAIMAQGALGATPDALGTMHAALSSWLVAEGALPEWRDLDTLAPALAHPGRHGALMLPWSAAIQALSTRMHSG